MDHWPQFHILWPLMRKSAVEVSMGLVTTRISLILGYQQSDNGREYTNQIVKETRGLWPGKVPIINR